MVNSTSGGPASARAIPCVAWTRTPRDTPRWMASRCAKGQKGCGQMRRGDPGAGANLLPLTADTRGPLAAPLWRDGPEGIHP